MNYSELVQKVYIETNRPDLVDETASAVIEATRTAHLSDEFINDLKAAQIAFDSAVNGQGNQTYLQVIDTRVMPLFRKAKYFRKNNPNYLPFQTNPLAIPNVDPILSGVDGFGYFMDRRFLMLNEISPEDIFDYFDTERFDVWYQAGNSICIKSSTPLNYILACWYAYPNTDISNNGANFCSWVANEYPWVIIYSAAGAVLSKIGQTEAAMLYTNPKGVGMADKQLALMIRNKINARSS